MKATLWLHDHNLGARQAAHTYDGCSIPWWHDPLSLSGYHKQNKQGSQHGRSQVTLVCPALPFLSTTHSSGLCIHAHTHHLRESGRATGLPQPVPYLQLPLLLFNDPHVLGLQWQLGLPELLSLTDMVTTHFTITLLGNSNPDLSCHHNS